MSLPKDFNWNIYLELNKDLKNKILNRNKAENHYLKHGIKENRKYKVDLPSDFQWKIYLKLNQNLKNKIFTEESAKKHYIEYGYKEKNYQIIIPNNFDWIAYLFNNPDVKGHNFDTEEKAKLHYLNYGFLENRNFTWTIENFQLLIKNEDCIIEKLIGNINSLPIDINTITRNLNIKDYSNDNNFTYLNYDSIKNLFNDTTYYYKNKLLDLYIESFILIIDFPNYGGGTQQFINAIISNYKLNNNFLIIRNNNNNLVEISVNDSFILEEKLDISKIIPFIEINKSKINKIFINHSYKHSFELIDKLFQLGKEVTTITHDYYSICNQPQLYYNEIKSKLNINSFILKCNNIITQNKNNLLIFEPFLSNKKVIVSPLPDLSKSLQHIPTNNNKIIIGLIGSISTPKGSHLVQFLIQKYKNNENIEIIIFGKIQFEYHNCFPYKNISELNELLITYKPNLILETSLWPETYSYTLTIAMLTQLPILCLKKNFNSVIEDRLSAYNKSYYFNNFNELEKLILSLKQDYFYTIDPLFNYNSFWNSYFFDSISQQELHNLQNKNDELFKNIKNKNIIFITSKIYLSEQPFSYTSKRSIYSSEERFLQTIETIQSVRQFIPDSYIILLDNSVFTLFEKSVLYKLCDYFINIINNESLNYYTNENKIKAYADISQQIAFLDLFITKANYLSIKNFFKLSGRYLINKDFNYSKFNNNKNLFKRNNNISKKDYFYTCFYKLDKSILQEYYLLLKSLFNVNKDELLDIDCEILLPKLISNKITEIHDSLGITQRVSVWKDLSNI